MADITTLHKHIQSLKEEFLRLSLVQGVDDIETDFIEEQTSNELGMCSVVAVSLGVITQSIKALVPFKAAAPIVSTCWVLGGVYCIYRLTAGTVLGWTDMLDRNRRRKRILREKLQALEDRIQILANLADILQEQYGGGLSVPEGEQHTPPASLRGEESPSEAVQRSPTNSQSSAELVEAPEENEVSGSTSGGSKKRGESSLDSLRRYAQLGKKDA